MGRPRMVRDEAEAHRYLEEAKREGVTATAWGREHGIDGRSLQAWATKFELGTESVAPTPAPHRLIELVPKPPEASSKGRYVLALGAARVEFDDDASAATLRRIVEVLRAC